MWGKWLETFVLHQETEMPSLFPHAIHLYFSLGVANTSHPPAFPPNPPAKLFSLPFVSPTYAIIALTPHQQNCILYPLQSPPSFVSDKPLL